MNISIIIPTYNSEAYLARAFASAVEQTGVSFEIILVDNNSTDGTLALSEQLRAAYPDLVRLAQEPTQGSAAARNHGVKLAKGEWIQFLDSDDVLLPGKLARQLGLTGLGVDWVIGPYLDRAIDGSEAITHVNTGDPWKGLVHNGGVGHTNSNLLRRQTYLDVGGQNEDLPNGVDTDLWFRLLCADVGLAFDPEPGSIYVNRTGPRLIKLKGQVSRTRLVRLKVRVIDYLKTERPDYYAANGNFFRAALLNAIRMLATENLAEAREAFRENFPEGIRTGDLDDTIVPPFVKLYGVFGFQNVEGLRMLLRHVVPVSLKRKIKGR